jgi:hypothetical protein
MPSNEPGNCRRHGSESTLEAELDWAQRSCIRRQRYIEPRSCRPLWSRCYRRIPRIAHGINKLVADRARSNSHHMRMLSLCLTAEAVSHSLQGLSAIADDLMAMAGDNGSQNNGWDEVQTKLQIDIRNDLAANLGGEFLISLDGPVLPTLSWKAIIEVRNADGGAGLRNRRTPRRACHQEWLCAEVH